MSSPSNSRQDTGPERQPDSTVDRRQSLFVESQLRSAVLEGLHALPQGALAAAAAERSSAGASRSAQHPSDDPW